MSDLARRHWPCANIGGSMICLALLATTPMARADDALRPNVLVVITDDQGFGDLGSSGNPTISTPHLDRFAAQSVRLDQFYVCPVCSPTRASLLTGRYYYRTGVVDTYLGRAMMHGDETTLAEMLAAAGYRTGIFGKWHLGDNYPLRPEDQGFQTSLVHRGGGIGQPADPPGNHYSDPVLFENGRARRFTGYCTDLFADAALRFIAADDQRPFFAYLAFNCPHTPLETVERYLARYEKRVVQGEAGPRPKALPVPAGSEIDETTAKVYSMVTHIDEQIGRLLARLEELALTENTIVIFLTDNGPQQPRYNAGMRDLKGTVYEGGIRVPCFARWPKRWPGRRTLDVPAAHIDWLPTLAAACGAALPSDRPIDGVDLGPLLSGQSERPPQRDLFVQYHRGDRPERFRSCAVRHGRWKLVQAEGTRQQPLPADWHYALYDLAADPGETRDLAREHPDVVSALDQAYRAWFDAMEAARHFEPPRILIGTPHESPTVLTRQDWRGTRAGWADENVGHWLIELAVPGEYFVRLRFAPSTIARTAQLSIADRNAQASVAVGATEVTLPISLAAGLATLEAQVVGGNRASGPHYVDVWRHDLPGPLDEIPAAGPGDN